MTDTTATTTTKSDLLTITEAAELLRTPVGTLRYWATWAPDRVAPRRPRCALLAPRSARMAAPAK